VVRFITVGAVIGETIEFDGRTIGYADYGPPDGKPVIWCHGGPGSRLEAQALAPFATPMGFRLIGIDRPGYGLSSPFPGRSIADLVPDVLAVADKLGIDRFIVVGSSTGGAYALALAAEAPDRVSGVIVCCAVTDMRWAEGKAMLDQPAVKGIWATSDRDTAIRIATEEFGAGREKMLEVASTTALPPADQVLLDDPNFKAGLEEALADMFSQGAVGYADDRIADGVGWGSFDVEAIRCPVVVLHGGSDSVVPVAHAHHTAEIVPGARLRIEEELGHFSIVGHVLAELPNV